jgi:plasmid stabilization system protein ParE
VTRYVLAPAAETDIRDIANYIAADNRDAALRLVDDFYAAFSQLADVPGLGHRRPDLTDQPLRFWTVRQRYLIIYRDRSPLEIVRVISGYRDIPTLLGG